MIVILAIMFAAAHQAQAGYGKDLGVLQGKAPAAATFAVNIDSVLKDYDCSREGDPDCAVWTAATILEHIEQGITNCDSARTSDDCVVALGLLGDASLSNADMQPKLAAMTMQMVMDEDHDRLLNAIYGGVADFLCYKMPITCDDLKALMGDVADLEAGGAP
ncbi:uncharacterized protein LOC134819999 [Bolinopsis microptera]|uniref:uncharacterized protein LOC134819999 n=1 Tax=Bolinopsis microptera TaxID=2820187 RepID=UPI00307A1251